MPIKRCGGIYVVIGKPDVRIDINGLTKVIKTFLRKTDRNYNIA